VLRGETRGYRHHPQLHRFQAHSAPRSAINAYLAIVLEEADARGYTFDRSKLGPIRGAIRLASTSGQLEYEWQHLLRKLQRRNPALHRRWRELERPDPHPLIRIVAGPVEPWERP
jgi:hypothetical protein